MFQKPVAATAAQPRSTGARQSLQVHGARASGRRPRLSLLRPRFSARPPRPQRLHVPRLAELAGGGASGVGHPARDAAVSQLVLAEVGPTCWTRRGRPAAPGTRINCPECMRSAGGLQQQKSLRDTPPGFSV